MASAEQQHLCMFACSGASPQHTHPPVLSGLLWSLPPSLSLTLLTPPHCSICPLCLFLSSVSSPKAWVVYPFLLYHPPSPQSLSCFLCPESSENPSSRRPLLTCLSPSTPSKGLWCVWNHTRTCSGTDTETRAHTRKHGHRNSYIHTWSHSHTHTITYSHTYNHTQQSHICRYTCTYSQQPPA